MNKIKPYLKLMRPHQWVKNGFIIAPLFFTPEAVTFAHVIATLMGVMVFCLTASAVYIVNDYCDREQDRLHPSKRFRPLASGAISPIAAFSLCGFLLILAFLLALRLPREFGVVAVTYLAINLLYSLWLKHQSLLDVILVAACYGLRVLAGAALIDVKASVWILSASFLLALFIALAKRRDDVVQEMDYSHRPALKGYNKAFLDQAVAICLALVIMCYLIYTTENDVMARAHTDKLYLTTPLVILGALRYLQLTMVEHKSGEPTMILLKDRFLLLCVMGWIVVYGLLIYSYKLTS
ncbi:MAG: UbiA prenyltransferase family protein [Alphaproteobacteria bacterium]|nr:UbiA prenyltransferase family protein [Alphaproteobacteria bacterium]